MTYSKAKHDEVETILDEYADEWIDRYMLDSVKEDIEPAMKANGANNVTVADIIFDDLKKISGDVVCAVASEQVIPEDVIYIIRNEIIDTLK